MAISRKPGAASAHCSSVCRSSGLNGKLAVVRPKTWDIGSALHRLLGSDLNVKGILQLEWMLIFASGTPASFQVNKEILRQTSGFSIWGSPSEEGATDHPSRRNRF